MKKYFAVLKTTLKDFKEYRSQVYITFVGWITRLLIIVFLWKSIFEAKETVGPYDFSGILTYFILVQIAMSFIFSHIGFHYAREIHNGDLSNYLHRPISYPLYKLVWEFGRNMARTIIGISIYGFIVLVFSSHFSFDISTNILPVALISLLLGYIINHCLVAVVGMLSFWITDSSRLVYIYFSIVTIFSGLIIPLDIFPEKIYKILLFTPFPYSFFIPVKIVQRGYGIENLPSILFSQASVTVILVAFAYLMYKKGLRRYEASGK